MSNTSVGTGRDHTNEIRRLSTLLEVSQALSGVLNLKAALQSVLDLLERRHQVIGGTIFLLDAGHARAARRGDGRHAPRARSGRGCGPATASPNGSSTPASRWWCRASARSRRWRPPPGERARGRELTYLAVPIAVGRRPGGTLEVVLTFKQDRDYQRSLEFYRVVASMIAQALKLRRTRRSRPQPAGRGERAPPRRAARQVRVPQHHRQQRLDPAGLRAGGAGGAHQHDGADPRRVGHRQGDDRARDPLQLAAREEAVHQGQLRGAARVADRVRAVRLREGGVHRRAGRQEGALRAGRGRHAVPRRDRRRQPRRRRSSCCACCRSARSSASAARRPSASTCG